MNESRPVRCELTMEETSLLTDLLKENLGKGKNDELINEVLASLQRAEDQTIEQVTVRGPVNDDGEYEW
jgi:hypothetical protein